MRLSACEKEPHIAFGSVSQTGTFGGLWVILSGILMWQDSTVLSKWIQRSVES